MDYALIQQIAALIDIPMFLCLADQDSVRFYPLCANCVARVETVGGPPPKEDKVYIL